MPVPQITLIGRLGTDPQLRTSANGNPYVRLFVIASTSTRNRETGAWEDGDQAALPCFAFGDMATNISQSLGKGMEIIAQGRLREGRPNPNQPESRGSLELLIDNIGPSLRRATAQVSRQSSSGNGGFSGNNGGFGGGNGGYQGGAGYSGGAGYQGNGGYQGGASAPMNAAPAQAAPAQAAPASDPWGSSDNSGSSFGSFGASQSFGGSSEFGGDSDEPEF